MLFRSEHEATLADRESVRLSLIHSVVNAYYNLRYLMAARQVQEKSIARYRDLLALVRAKAEQSRFRRWSCRRALARSWWRRAI